MSLGPILVSGAPAASPTVQSAWSGAATANLAFYLNNRIVYRNVAGAAGVDSAVTNTGKSIGKQYLELQLMSDPGGSTYEDSFIGIDTNSTSTTFTSWDFYARLQGSVVTTSTGATITNGNLPSLTASPDDIYMYAVDFDNGRIYIGRNGSWGSQDPSAGTGAVVTNWTPSGTYYFHTRIHALNYEFMMPAGPTYTVPTGFSVWS